MDRSEEEDLNDAALQLLNFLGQVYVQLQEAQAVEEYVCEQYEASIRFLRRCTSGSSNSGLLESEAPTRSSRILGKKASQLHNGSGHTREQQQQIMKGPDGDRSKELAALCGYLDTVIAEAQAVREGFNEALMSKGGGKIRGPKFAGNRQLPNANKDVADRGSSIAVTQTVNEIIVDPARRTEDKIIRPKSRTASIGSHKTAELQRPFVTGAPGACNKMQSRKTSPESQSDQRLRLPLSTTRPKPRPAPASSTRQEELAIKSTANFQTLEKCRLRFPEKYRTLRCWFKAREGYWLNTYAESRIKSAAEEAFISLLDDVYNQQELGNDSQEYEVAASPIRELQKIMEVMASRTSDTQMISLLRLAPAGSKIADMRNFSMQKLLLSGKRDADLVTKLEKDKLDTLEAPNSSWLPRRCWVHSREVLNSLQLDDFSVKELERGVVTYFEQEFLLAERVFRVVELMAMGPKHEKQIVVIARLSHCIQVTLFYCYLEEVFAQSLLHRCSEKEDVRSITRLLRCQLAHSILCKEGRALFVLAEKVTATA